MLMKSKEKNRLLLALLLSMAFNVAFIAAVGYREFIARRPCDITQGKQQDAKIKLSEEQKKQFDENKRQLEKQLVPLRLQMAAHCKNLSNILASSSPSAESIHAETASLADVQRKVQNLILDNYLKNRTSLTKEQRYYFDGKLREDLCSSSRCGTGGMSEDCPMEKER